MTTPYDTIKSAVLGNPPDPTKKPSRQGVVKAFAEMQAQLEGAQAGALVFGTVSQMAAAGAVPSANIMAWVINDAVQVNNGIYQNTGSAGTPTWTRRGNLPQFLITGMNVGAGTANNLQATTDLAIPIQDARALLIFNVTENNTGPATVSFNGGSQLEILTNSGASLVANSLVAGMNIAGFISGSGTKFRMISDPVSNADRVAAEAARDAAIAAAGSIDLPSVTGQAGKELAVNSAGNGYELVIPNITAMNILDLAGNSWPYVDEPTNSLRLLLQAKLDARDGAGYWHVMNKGVGGSTLGVVSGGAPYIIDEVNNQIIRYANARVVYCGELFINDASLGATDTDMITSAQNLIDALEGAGLQYVFSNTPPFRGTGANGSGSFYTVYSDAPTNTIVDPVATAARYTLIKGYFDNVDAWIAGNVTVPVLDFKSFLDDGTGAIKATHVLNPGNDDYHLNHAVGKDEWADEILALIPKSMGSSERINIKTSPNIQIDQSITRDGTITVKQIVGGRDDGAVGAVETYREPDIIKYGEGSPPPYRPLSYWAQPNTAGAGYGKGVTVAGEYKIQYFNGVAFVDRLTLGQDRFNMFKPVTVSGDTNTALFTGAVYGGGVGSSLAIAPLLSYTGFGMSYFATAGSTWGKADFNAADYTWKIAGVDKAQIAADGGFVNLSGYVKLQGFGGDSARGRVIFGAAGTSYIGYDSAGYLLGAGSYCLPVTANAMTLGASSNDFSNIYSRNPLTVVSDVRTKTKIKQSDLGLSFVLALNPVSFYQKEGGIDLVPIYEDSEEHAHDENGEPLFEKKQKFEKRPHLLVHAHDENGQPLFEKKAILHEIAPGSFIQVMDENGNPKYEETKNPLMIPDTADHPIFDEQGNPVFETDFNRPIMRKIKVISGHKKNIKKGKRKHYGLIAQEVKSVMDKMGIEDFGGWVKQDINDPESLEMLRLEQFISPLIKTIQELHARLLKLEEK